MDPLDEPVLSNDVTTQYIVYNRDTGAVASTKTVVDHSLEYTGNNDPNGQAQPGEVEPHDWLTDAGHSIENAGGLSGIFKGLESEAMKGLLLVAIIAGAVALIAFAPELKAITSRASKAFA